LVGSAPELGGGQPDASPTLSWSQGDMWSTEVALGPGAYDFKVLVYNRSSQAMQWEGLAGSRLLLVPSTPGLLLVSCQWGSSSLQTRSLSWICA
ncbi:CBM20 domain-containing protein, partial [Haematococcus lacustris]